MSNERHKANHVAKICRLHPGDQVRMVNCMEAEKYAGRVWIVASEPWEVCGSLVVLLEGYSGGFDCECLELA